MKKQNLIYPLMAMVFALILSSSCKKKNDSNNPTPTPTPTNNTVKDIDGNVYHTVTIGKQVWMVENLKTTKYRNGDAIGEIEDSATWANIYNTSATTRTPAWCYYHGNAANHATYG